MNNYAGSLFRRNGTGPWYLKLRTGGKETVRSMRTEDRMEAERRAQDLTLPMTLRDDLAAQKLIADRILGAETRVARADATTRTETTRGTPLGTVADLYETSPGRDHGASSQRYQRAWGSLCDSVGPAIEDAEQLTRDMVDAWASGLLADPKVTAQMYNSMVKRNKAIWSVVFPDLPSPFRHLVRQKEQKAERRALSDAEVAALLETPDRELRRLILVGAFTALRLGDCCLLRWESVDFAANVITVVPSKTKGTSRAVKIPIHSDLRSDLERTTKCERVGYVCPRMAEQYTVRPQKVNDILQELFATAGIKTSRAVEGRARKASCAGFHSLRHRFVTVCMRAGIPRAWVEEIVGHTSDVVNRVYTHMGLDAASAAIDALPSLSGRCGSTSNLTTLVAAMDSATDATWRTAWLPLRELLAVTHRRMIAPSIERRCE